MSDDSSEHTEVDRLVRAIRAGTASEDELRTVLESRRSKETWSPDGATDPVVSAVESLLDGADPDSVAERLEEWLAASGRSHRYRIRHSLGQGGMGEVVAATDMHLERKVALKFLPAEAPLAVRKRFRREAHLTARLTHPNIVPVHDSGEAPDGRAFISMKEVEGRSLGEVVAAGEMSLRERLEVFDRVCDAMAYAHAQGVVHRDLKPDNVMVGAFGEVLVMDWGLARSLEVEDLPTDDGGGGDVALTRAGQIMGTPAYMSPEQARGEGSTMGPPGDVYALGAVLFSLLTDARPLEGADAMEMVQAVAEGAIRDPLEVRPQASREVAAIVRKAMQLEPAGRYPDVVSLQADIKAFLAGEPVSVVQYSLVERVRRWTRRNRQMLRGGGAAAAVLGPVVVGVVVVALLGGVVLTANYVVRLRAKNREVQTQAFRETLARGEALRQAGRLRDAREAYREAAARAGRSRHLDGRRAALAIATTEADIAPQLPLGAGKSVGDLAPDRAAITAEGGERCVVEVFTGERSCVPHEPGVVVGTWGTARFENGELVVTSPEGAVERPGVAAPGDPGARLLSWFPEQQVASVALSDGRQAFWTPAGGWVELEPGWSRAEPVADGVGVWNDQKVVRVLDPTGAVLHETMPTLSWSGRSEHPVFAFQGALGRGLGAERVWERRAVGVAGVAHSSDASELAVWTRDGIEILDSATGEPREQLELSRPSGVALDQGLVFASTYGGKIYAQARQQRIPLAPELPVRAQVSPDGDLLLIGSKQHAVELRDALTGAVFWRRPVDHWAMAVAFSDDGRTAWVGSRPDLIGFDVVTGEERVRHADVFDSNVLALADVEGRLVASLADPPRLVALDPASGEVLQSLALPLSSWDLAEAGGRIITAGVTPGPEIGVVAADLRSREALPRPQMCQAFGSDVSGDRVALAGTGCVMAVDVAKGRSRSCPLEGRGIDVAWLDDEVVAVVDQEGRLTFVDLEDCTELHRVQTGATAASLTRAGPVLWSFGVGGEVWRQGVAPRELASSSNVGALRRTLLEAGALEAAARLPGDGSMDAVRAQLHRGPTAVREALRPASDTGRWWEVVRHHAGK